MSKLLHEHAKKFSAEIDRAMAKLTDERCDALENAMLSVFGEECESYELYVTIAMYVLASCDKNGVPPGQFKMIFEYIERITATKGKTNG